MHQRLLRSMLATCGRIRRHHAEYTKAATDPDLTKKFLDLWVDKEAWTGLCAQALGEALGAFKTDEGV
eukprot:8418714-Alexandrium_andersonii.AAC.1